MSVNFYLVEINNEPVSNTIPLGKQIAQNLTCNRLSQFVPVQWFKVNHIPNIHCADIVSLTTSQMILYLG